MTINQNIELFHSVFQGKNVTINSNNPRTICTFSSDGINWLVNGTPTSTIEDRKKALEFIITKGELAVELARYVGEDLSSLFDEYQLVYDGLDGMILLTKNEASKIVFIYIISTSFAIEQIDKIEGKMTFNRFWVESDELKHRLAVGKLSSKSLQVIKKKSCSMTQNFYYDMFFTEMKSYSEMINAGNMCENPIFTDNAVLVKIKKRLHN